MFDACSFRQRYRIFKEEESAGKSPALLFFAAAVVVSVLLLMFPYKEALILRDEASDKMLLALPIEEGDLFEIRFTHSVNLSPVKDQYQWIGDSIILQSTTFQAYGAGIPVLQDGMGAGFEQSGDGFTITGINSPRDKISIMLQTVPDHTLLYSNREIRLLEFADSGTVVTIYVGKISVAVMLLTQL